MLTPIFYARDTVKVAPDLLGKFLVRASGVERMVCRIVEVEAYRGRDDPASHAFRGPTPRNAPMFGDPGHAYIYFTYGNHFLLNITTQKRGVPGAVLIRAVEPVEGIDLMRRFRPHVPDSELTSGPGKLTKALAIDKSLNEHDMTVKGPLFVVDYRGPHFEIWRSKRIGIGDISDKRWRFYIHGNRYVSRPHAPLEAKFR
jgi:DNA-3-methyladenine glycosylase